MSLNNREQNILQLADDLPHPLLWHLLSLLDFYRILIRLRGQDDLDEATIDAEFLFRFEPTWCEWVNRIRRMMRALMGQTGNEPLSTEDGASWLVHLDANRGLQLSIEVGPNGTRYDFGSSYDCLDSELAGAFERAIGNKNETEHLFQRMWVEANQTVKIRGRLQRLARMYSLIPPKHEQDEHAPAEVNSPVAGAPELRPGALSAELGSEGGAFTPPSGGGCSRPPAPPGPTPPQGAGLRHVVKRQFQSVVNWVVWGDFVPSFPWPITRLLESRTSQGVKRTIRPHRWSGEDPVSLRLGLDVRVRTWTIYYLTRRGGGQRTEQSAVDLWNGEFPDDKVSREQFRDERSQLLSRGTKKRLIKPAAQLEQLESMIRDFTALIDSGPGEEDVQRHLTANWLLLAPTANKVTPKVELGSEYVTDFVIEFADQQYILVEIERPGYKLYTQTGDPRAELSHALRQVKDWRQWIYDNIAYARTIMPGINEPDCWVIIGRQSHMVERDQKALARENGELPHIRILTYDDLLDTAKHYLDNLRRL